MDNGQDRDDSGLEMLFEAIRTVHPTPSASLMTRLSTDAEMSLPSRVQATERPHRSSFGWIGGLFAASGLSGAAALGVWIGFMMPDVVDPLAQNISGNDAVLFTTFLPGTDLGALDE